MNLNPQAEIIYQILLDGNWHCPKEWNYADGHCKRITDINKFLLPIGKEVDSKRCDCGRHLSGVFKRRIILKEIKTTISGNSLKEKLIMPNMINTGSIPVCRAKSDTCNGDYKCYSYRKFNGVCSCKRVEVKEILNQLF